jgi:hypothetical protein
MYDSNDKIIKNDILQDKSFRMGMTREQVTTLLDLDLDFQNYKKELTLERQWLFINLPIVSIENGKVKTNNKVLNLVNMDKFYFNHKIRKNSQLKKLTS